MTENEKVQFRNEGDPAFGEDSENDNSAGSPPEENNTDNADDSSGDGGEKKPDAKQKEVPFDQHPAWAEREKKWDERFNTQESRHQEDLRKLREEFGGSKKASTETPPIASWFGGNQEQWEQYLHDESEKLKATEERAFERINSAKTAEAKAVEDATAYMQTEMATIESDKTLNPSGAKIDPNKLLKFVLDNDLVDSKGRWNYKAGFRMMQAGETKKPAGDRKVLADASTSEGKPETKPTAFKTSADFKKNRPW